MDYPAAHSMDTMWFAVDADGHVAAFDTGESGGVPVIAMVEDHWHLLQQLCALGAKLEPNTHTTLDATAEVRIVARITDTKANKKLLARMGCETADTGVLLVVANADAAAAFAELHDRGACGGCARYDSIEDDDDLANRGVFHYKCDDPEAGPYDRTGVPEQPLAIADVPPALRANAIKFAGRFADTPVLQPAEHWKSDGWGATWLASDGKTIRPFHGRNVDDDRRPEDFADFVVVREPLDVPDGELAGGPRLAQPAPVYEELDDNFEIPEARAPAKKPWWKLW